MRNRCPMPLIESSKGQVFNRLDLQGAYNIVGMKQGHELKTAFRTTWICSSTWLCRSGSRRPRRVSNTSSDIFKHEQDVRCVPGTPTSQSVSCQGRTMLIP